MRPDSLDDVEHECGGEAEQNPSVEGFECAHQAPLGLQGNVGVTVTCHGVEGVEHGIFSQRDCAQHSEGEGPHEGFTPVQDGTTKCCSANRDDREDFDKHGSWPAPKQGGNRLIEEPEARRVKHNRGGDDGEAPQPIGLPFSQSDGGHGKRCEERTASNGKEQFSGGSHLGPAFHDASSFA